MRENRAGEENVKQTGGRGGDEPIRGGKRG